MQAKLDSMLIQGEEEQMVQGITELMSVLEGKGMQGKEKQTVKSCFSFY
ncbi:hypothetical protein NGE73_23460 [Bacillus cereus]|nr:hypothetical protein [Bacillus cereus]MDE7545720.1 hypothetical protein [Bacillus cereus]